MKTSEILVKAGNIYIEAGRKIAEAEKLLNMITGNVSIPDKRKKKTEKIQKIQKQKKVKEIKTDTGKGSGIVDKLSQLMERTESLAGKASEIAKSIK